MELAFDRHRRGSWTVRHLIRSRLFRVTDVTQVTTRAQENQLHPIGADVDQNQGERGYLGRAVLHWRHIIIGRGDKHPSDNLPPRS